MAALVQAALVTVAPGPEEHCPSSAQVQAALETHAPRLVTSGQADDSATPLTLTLSPAFATGEMSIMLIDKAGLVKLYRVLPPPPGDRARDCAALADTVAFIVDRYFNEVELPELPERKPLLPPPAPPPPAPKPELPARTAPRYELSGTFGRRVPGGATDLGGYEYKLTGGAAVTSFVLAGGRPWVDLSVGLVGIATHSWDSPKGRSTANVMRSGADLALLLGWQVWRGRLYAGPQASLEVIWLDWRDAEDNDQLRSTSRFAWAAGLRTGYQYLWRERFFARADVSGNLALVRQEIIKKSSRNVELFEAPRTYLTLAFGVGIWF